MKRETAPRFAGIGGHHSHRAGTIEWLTPPDMINDLGGWERYALDPCAPLVQPWPTARRIFTKVDNGLLQRWEGKVLLNPPYGNEVARWLARLAEHGDGVAIVFARTDTEAFHRFVKERATAALFLEGRVTFRVGEPFTDPKTRKRYELGDPAPGNAGGPTVLCAYGMASADVLAGYAKPGLFVALNVPRSVLVEAVREITWRELVDEFGRSRRGPFHVSDLYRFVRSHPKARGNGHPEAKARQQLQMGSFRNVEPGVWERIQ